jgi:hypothetical protein
MGCNCYLKKIALKKFALHKMTQKAGWQPNARAVAWGLKSLFTHFAYSSQTASHRAWHLK